jgi:hypothetical protein
VGFLVVTLRQKNTFGYMVDYARADAPLFAARGDTAKAIAAYQYYLTLREERPAYAPWAAQWDSVRVEYQALLAPRLNDPPNDHRD